MKPCVHAKRITQCEGASVLLTSASTLLLEYLLSCTQEPCHSYGSHLCKCIIPVGLKAVTSASWNQKSVTKKGGGQNVCAVTSRHDTPLLVNIKGSSALNKGEFDKIGTRTMIVFRSRIAGVCDVIGLPLGQHAPHRINVTAYQ